MKCELEIRYVYVWDDLVKCLGKERAERLRKRGSLGKAYKGFNDTIYFERENMSRWAKVLVDKLYK